MKCKIIRDHETLIYRITDPEGVAENILNSLFYQKRGNFYEKSLPLKSMMFEQNFSEIESRYNLFINRELNHTYNKEIMDQALITICEGHQARDINWWLAGSAALYVRGLDIEPHDLDVMTYLQEKDKVKNFVMPYIVEAFHNVSSWVVKGFGVIDLGLRIDYAFEPESFVDNDGFVDFGPYAEAHLEKIRWKGYEILIPPVELHLKSNIARNRKDTIQKIREYIEINH